MSKNNKIKITIMSARSTPSIALHPRTRRQAIAGTALTLLSLSPGSKLWGSTQQSAVKEAPPTAANQKRTSLHQEVDVKANPQRIYEALLDAKQFAALTGMSAEIDPKAGGAFSTFGGLIAGRNVELIPNQRIVQAWRPTHWDSGVYSIVKFELKPRAAETTIILDHTGFPEGEYDSLNSGWKARYWDPLKKFLA
jgi:activator of HSP90 ATPase